MIPRFKIRRIKRVDSTTSAAFRWADRGAPSGTVIVSDYQTRGHGKFGRRWVSPRGKNLLFSVLLRPSFKAGKAPLLTQIACRTVSRVLERELGLETTFKRPNDVLVGGRKISGVLVEAKGRSNGDLDCLVIGIGLNVNARREELVPGATSLIEETGRKQSRFELLKELLRQLKKDLKGFKWQRIP